MKIAQRSSRRQRCTINGQSDHVGAESFEEVRYALVQAWQSIGPAAPISSRAGDNGTVESKPAAASGQVTMRQNCSKFYNVGSYLQQKSGSSSNMLISSYGVVAAELWRSGPENVIGTGRTTEEKEKPCHLCFWYSAQVVEELTFVLEFVLEDCFAKSLRAER